MSDELGQDILDGINSDIEYINNQMMKVEKVSPITGTQFGLILLAVAIVCVLLVIAGLLPGGVIAIGPLAATAILFSIISDYRNKKFAHIKKLIDEFLAKLISVIKGDLEFSQEGFINKTVYYRSGLFDTVVDNYAGNNMFRGKMGQTDFMMSNVWTSVSGENNDIIVFRGILIVAEFSKNFKGKTIILPDITEEKYGSLIGTWLQKKSRRIEELVKLEDVDFEKEFVVYSTDQIEARYILSPSLMEKLTLLSEKYAGIAVSFVDNKMFVAIPTNNIISFNLPFDILIDKEEVYYKYNILKNMVNTCETIIEELGLNNRIWVDDCVSGIEASENAAEEYGKYTEKEISFLEAYKSITWLQSWLFSIAIVAFLLVEKLLLPLVSDYIDGSLITTLAHIAEYVLFCAWIVYSTILAINIFGKKNRIHKKAVQKLAILLSLIPVFLLVLPVYIFSISISSTIEIIFFMAFAVYYSSQKNLSKYAAADYEPEYNIRK